MLNKYGRCGYVPPIATSDYILMTDGTEYPIDSPAEFAFAGTTSSTQTFTSNGISVSIMKADVKEVQVAIPLARGGEPGFCAYLFSDYVNCDEFKVSFSGNLTSAGFDFARAMFLNCANLTVLPQGFNLPQNLVSVGGFFVRSMFANCISLSSLPQGFNFPQGLTWAGGYFALNMFANCNKIMSGDSGVALTFPYEALDCFSGSCPAVPDSPAAGETVYIINNN